MYCQSSMIVLNICIRFHFNIIHRGPGTRHLIFITWSCNSLSPTLLLQFSLLSKFWARSWKLVKEPWNHQKFVLMFRCQIDFPCTYNLTSQSPMTSCMAVLHNLWHGAVTNRLSFQELLFPEISVENVLNANKLVPQPNKKELSAQIFRKPSVGFIFYSAFTKHQNCKSLCAHRQKRPHSLIWCKIFFGETKCPFFFFISRP